MQSPRFTRKIKLLQSFCSRVTLSNSDICSGWFCKGDDLKKSCKYCEYGLYLDLFFFYVCVCVCCLVWLGFALCVCVCVFWGGVLEGGRVFGLVWVFFLFGLGGVVVLVIFVLFLFLKVTDEKEFVYATGFGYLSSRTGLVSWQFQGLQIIENGWDCNFIFTSVQIVYGMLIVVCA